MGGGSCLPSAPRLPAGLDLGPAFLVLGTQWLWKHLGIVKDSSTMTSCYSLGGSSCQERNLFPGLEASNPWPGNSGSSWLLRGPRGSSVTWSWVTMATAGAHCMERCRTQSSGQ